MRICITKLLLISAILLMGYWRDVESSIPSPQNETKPGAFWTSEEDSAGWVVALEDVWYTFIDEPEEHFQFAQKKFDNQEMNSAAHEIRRARAFVRLETFRVVDPADYDLLWSAVDKLSSLAKKVEDGEVNSVDELEGTFAEVHYDLAKHHYKKAGEFWDDQEGTFTGKDLAAADINLGHSMEWAGYTPNNSEQATIQKASVISAKLIEGKGYKPIEVGKTMIDLGQIIEELGSISPFAQR